MIGTEQTDLQPSARANSTVAEQIRADEPNAYDHVIRIVAVDSLVTNLVFLQSLVFRLQTLVDLLHHLRLKLERSDDIALLAVAFAASRPLFALLGDLLVGLTGTLRSQNDFLHHLTDRTVGEDQAQDCDI